MFAISLILVGSSDRHLEDVLRNVGSRVTAIPGSELATLAQAGSKQPDVIVLDLRDQGHIPSALAQLKRQHPATGTLIVAPRLDPALMLEAMRAGVNEFVTDPVTEDELKAAIARVMAQRPMTAPLGQIFAFLGAKGGVGTTTVSVNVATALSQIEPNSTLFIDLHLANGDAAVFIGAEPRFSVVDALENTHRLDEAFFKSLVVRSKAGLDLLASSDRALVSPVDVGRIRALIEFAARQYRFVVLDLPRSDASVLEALDAVAKITIVTNQELTAVRECGPDGHGISTALWARAIVGRAQPIGSARRDRPRGHRTGHWQLAQSLVPERLPSGPAGTQQGPSRHTRQPQRTRGRTQEVRARYGGRLGARRRAEQRRPLRPPHGPQVQRRQEIGAGSMNSANASLSASTQLDMRLPQYQELKSKIHTELLGRLNLERLTRIKREDAEPEIRGLIVGMLERESRTTPLSLFEREASSPTSSTSCSASVRSRRC